MANTAADRALKLFAWVPALYAAYIMLWYEQYKLTAHEGSVMLFTILSDWLFISGYEQPFRLTVAIAEIVAAVLIINVPTRMYGAGLTLGLMSGAIFFHVVSPLGIDPYGDGGELFKEACMTWVSAAVVLVIYRAEALALVERLLGRPLGTAQLG